MSRTKESRGKIEVILLPAVVITPASPKRRNLTEFEQEILDLLAKEKELFPDDPWERVNKIAHLANSAPGVTAAALAHLHGKNLVYVKAEPFGNGRYGTLWRIADNADTV